MKSIMVVDDETHILEKVRNSLKEDFNIVVASDSRQALEKMSEDEDNYGLLLISTQIPGTQKTALFSMKPKSKINIDVSKEEDFLQKPFTEEQLKHILQLQGDTLV